MYLCALEKMTTLHVWLLLYLHLVWHGVTKRHSLLYETAATWTMKIARVELAFSIPHDARLQAGHRS